VASGARAPPLTGESTAAGKHAFLPRHPSAA
jgi:hypothetical protein